ncbi:SNTB1 [Anthophora plagiata]
MVKYLREVTPYFRKASIIQEVGWELQRGFLSATPPPPKSPPRADTRYLPLQLCRLTRAHPSSDPGKFFIFLLLSACMRCLIPVATPNVVVGETQRNSTTGHVKAESVN